MTADTMVEISMPSANGAIHSALFKFSKELTYPDIFRAAHQNADGSVPTLEQLGGNTVIFDHVRRLRAVEDEVIRRANEDRSIGDKHVTDVINCARCGGSHSQVVFRPLARPFAPVEAAPIVWERWAPCPTNGDPILQARNV